MYCGQDTKPMVRCVSMYDLMADSIRSIKTWPRKSNSNNKLSAANLPFTTRSVSSIETVLTDNKLGSLESTILNN